jgi:acyl-CoA thioesterase FadM
MSGLLRNLNAVLRAVCHPAVVAAAPSTTAWFRVMPWDTGLLVLKSDTYLQLAESAQLDYLVKTRLLMPLLRKRIRFVNMAQMVRFLRPIRLLQKVRVETSITHADDRCAYFCHALFVGSVQHAEVLVKMKFKNGSKTVPPHTLISVPPGSKPHRLVAWDQALGESKPGKA